MWRQNSFTLKEASYLLNKISELNVSNLEGYTSENYKRFLNERFGGLDGKRVAEPSTIKTLRDNLEKFNKQFKKENGSSRNN